MWRENSLFPETKINPNETARTHRKIRLQLFHLTCWPWWNIACSGQFLSLSSPFSILQDKSFSCNYIMCRPVWWKKQFVEYKAVPGIKVDFIATDCLRTWYTVSWFCSLPVPHGFFCPVLSILAATVSGNQVFPSSQKIQHPTDLQLPGFLNCKIYILFSSQDHEIFWSFVLVNGRLHNLFHFRCSYVAAGTVILYDHWLNC